MMAGCWLKASRRRSGSGGAFNVPGSTDEFLMGTYGLHVQLRDCNQSVCTTKLRCVSLTRLDRSARMLLMASCLSLGGNFRGSDTEGFAQFRVYSGYTVSRKYRCLYVESLLGVYAGVLF